MGKGRVWTSKEKAKIVVQGLKGRAVAEICNNGSPPTSLTFMRECRALGIRQAFTAYANPKGNAATERLIRTIKEELCWLREWSSVQELATEMEKFVEYFNEQYLHSAIGYKTPNAFENKWFKNNQITRSATA